MRRAAGQATVESLALLALIVALGIALGPALRDGPAAAVVSALRAALGGDHRPPMGFDALSPAVRELAYAAIDGGPDAPTIHDALDLLGRRLLPTEARAALARIAYARLGPMLVRTTPPYPEKPRGGGTVHFIGASTERALVPLLTDRRRSEAESDAVLNATAITVGLVVGPEGGLVADVIAATIQSGDRLGQGLPGGTRESDVVICQPVTVMSYPQVVIGIFRNGELIAREVKGDASCG